MMALEFVDAHHHFVDTASNAFQTFLKSVAGGDIVTLPEQYEADVKTPLLERAGVKVIGSVHMECMPDDGSAETTWVQSLIDSGRCNYIAAIVGSVDLASSNSEMDIVRLKKSSNKVRGVRWILDCVGKFDNNNSATHIATTRHDGIDYLRGSNGRYDGQVVPSFEEGYGKLANYGLSFDLHCAPEQLLQAAALAQRHPNVPVCINHMGKLRLAQKWDDMDDGNMLQQTLADDDDVAVWRTGMEAMANLSHVYVKLSLLGYAVPGWSDDTKKETIVKLIVCELVQLFGPKRCMIGTNWWQDAAMSDSDGRSNIGPDAVTLLQKFSIWLSDYSPEDRYQLFSGTARAFYRF